MYTSRSTRAIEKKKLKRKIKWQIGLRFEHEKPNQDKMKLQPKNPIN